MTTYYRIKKDKYGYQVSDGIWSSAHYKTKKAARSCLKAACWGEKGADGMGTKEGRIQL